VEQKTDDYAWRTLDVVPERALNGDRGTSRKRTFHSVRTEQLTIINIVFGTMSCLSKRGQFNVDQIIAKIPRAILEPTSDPKRVNLSMAENHLIRDEVAEIVRTAIQKSFQAEVRYASIYAVITYIS
jgi:hypothetical protein